MSNSSKLLERIRAEKITPIPKWQFSSKQWSLWVGFIASIIFGALSFSVILFTIQQTDFILLNHLSHSKAEFILGVLPFFWLISLFVFLGFAFYSVQFTNKGYKISSVRMVAFGTAMSIVLGTIYFIGGGSSKLEQTFATNLSLYEGLEKKKIKLWSMPESGYLSGEILSLEAEVLRLKDSKGKIWVIDFSDSFVAPILLMEEGLKIKLIGKMQSDGNFKSEEIRPWGGREKRFHR